MLSPPLRTMPPGSNGSPMQSALNANKNAAATQAELVNPKVKGGTRRHKRGGGTVAVPVLPTLYKSNMVNGTTQQQVGTQQVGQQMGVQSEKDNVPLVKGGKKSRKSRKSKKSRKSRKSKKSRKSTKGRK